MIKIITDSSSYFEKAAAEALGVRVIPLRYTVGGQFYYETYSDRNGEFEKLFSGSQKKTTDAPGISTFISAIEEEKSRGNEVLCITLSSRLSGAYAAAYTAVKQVSWQGAEVFDSMMTAGGLYLLVKEAVAMAKTGATLSEIVTALPDIRDRIKIAFSVGDMTPLRNSGRLGAVRMRVATILNIRPLLLCEEGAVCYGGTARGSGEIVRAMLEQIPPTAREIIINYIENSRLAELLYSAVKEAFSDIPTRLQRMGPVLGIHLGMDTVAVCSIK